MTSTATQTSTPTQQRRANRSQLVRDYGIIISIGVLVVLLSVSTDTFLTAGNLRNLVDQMAVVGILACGATLCIISGIFDLSTSAVLAVSAVVGVFATQSLGVGAAGKEDRNAAEDDPRGKGGNERMDSDPGDDDTVECP